MHRCLQAGSGTMDCQGLSAAMSRGTSIDQTSLRVDAAPTEMQLPIACANGGTRRYQGTWARSGQVVEFGHIYAAQTSLKMPEDSLNGAD